MAQSYDRRINLFLNGEKVANDVKSIRAELSKVTNETNRMTIGSEEYRKSVEKIKTLKGALKEHSDAIGQTKKPMQGLIDTAKSLLPAFGVTAIVAGLSALWGKIKGIRGEFEKYEAVLTNTFGSQRTARKELDMLSQFAAETPFQLTELTGAFVKLVNYGLRPTKDELTKYGDLASSVGKGFDQLVEGIADAVTGEYERLKEFGIKAKAAGDKVTFTFKEQSTTVDNTAASIKKYILGLGSLEGVSGSMSAISKTMVGATSNMGDAVDRLLNKIGAGGLGQYYVHLVRMATDFIDNLTGKSKTYREDLESTTLALNSELDVLRTGNFTTDERKKMIREINREYKDYLPFLIDENATLKQIEGYQGKINQHLQARIIYAAYEEEITAILKKQKDSLASNYEIEKKRTQLKLGQDKTVQDSPFAEQQNKMLGNIENINNAVIQNTAAATDEAKKKYDSMGKAIGLTFADIEAIVNKAKTPKTTPHKITDKERSAAEKKALEDLEARNKAEISKINKKHLDSKNSEAQYNADLLTQEFKFLQEKRDIYEKGSKEYEDADAAFTDRQVKAQKQVKLLLLQAEKELSDAKIENLKDGIDKEKTLENQRWNDELTGLNKQLTDIAGVSKEEIELRDTINKIIEEKEKAHNHKMKILNSADDIENLKKEQDALSEIKAAANDSAESTPWLSKDQIEKFFDARRTVLEESYKIEQQLAGDDHEKQLAATNAYNNEVKKLKKQEVAVTYDAALRRIDIAQSFLGVLSGVVDQESALGKALFLFQQGLTIASIWISTAKANAAAVAALILPPLWAPVVAANTVYAGVQTALVLAQTVANFAGKGKGKGKAEGGFTEPGGKYEPAGIVHKGEYVIPQEGVNNPYLQPLIWSVESARRNHRLASLQPNSVVMSMYDNKLASGGYADRNTSLSSLPSPSGSLPGSKSRDSGDELLKAVDRLNRNLEKGIRATINKYGTNGVSESLDDIAAFKKKIYG